MACGSFFTGGDPLDIVIFGKPGSQLSLTANRIVQDFTITTDSYVLMCTHLYEVLCSEKPKFADNISESAFQYYAIMLLWQRISKFLPPRSRKLSPFLDKLHYFEPYMTRIPKSLEKYLEGIGNFQHPYIGEMRFRLPEPLISQSFDLTTGTFGKVSADTHFLYEAFPAPGIAALRILADINITNNRFGNCDWDLPKELRPDIGDGPSVAGQAKLEPKPTKNLLGWSPAQRLTKNQLELFRSSGIESILSHSDLTQFFKNSIELLKTINKYFSGTSNGASKPPSMQPVTTSNNSTTVSTFTPHKKTNAVCAQVLVSQPSQTQSSHIKYESFGTPAPAPPQAQTQSALILHSKTSPLRTQVLGFQPAQKRIQVNDTLDHSEGFNFTKIRRLQFTGSVIQGLSVKKISESSEFDRSTMYCEGEVSVFSPFKVNDNLVTGAVAAGYRMPKEPILPNRHSWSCYDFNKYECVPQSWISTRNSIYMFKNIEGLNRPVWTTGTTDKRLTQYSFLKLHENPDENSWNVYM